MRQRVLLLSIMALVVVSSGCTDSNKANNLSKTELNMEAKSTEWDALKRSPSVFEGEVLAKKGRIVSVKPLNNGYRMEFRTAKTIPKPFMVDFENYSKIGKLESMPNSLNGTTYSPKDGETSDYVYLWGRFTGLKNVQLEDRSYADYPHLQLLHIDTYRYDNINLTIDSSFQADRICVNDVCKTQKQKPSFIVSNNENHTLIFGREGFETINRSISVQKISTNEASKSIFPDADDSFLKNYIGNLYNGSNFSKAYSILSERIKNNTSRAKWIDNMESRHSTHIEQCEIAYQFEALESTYKDDSGTKVNVLIADGGSGFRSEINVVYNGEWKIDENYNPFWDYLTYNKDCSNN
jgi:hypothetical protein